MIPIPRFRSPAMVGSVLALVLALSLVPLAAATAADDVPIDAPAAEVSEEGVSNSEEPNVILCTGCGNSRQTVRVSGPTFISKRHVQYLTPAWAKASSYSWGKSTTVSASLSSNIGISAAGVSSAIGATASASQTWSVSITIPAYKARYSKLSLASDFNRYYVKSRAVRMGVPLDWQYSYLYSPKRGAQYLIVRYQ